MVMLTFVAGEVVVPRLTGPRIIGDGLTVAVGPAFAVMVKANEVAGVGPPPGSGLVIVTVAAPAVVSTETGTGTVKPVPPPVTCPPASGTPTGLPGVKNVTAVPATKSDPEKVRVTGVYVVVAPGDMVFAVRIGFITVNGKDLLFAPCGSLTVTW